jgi:hypothetical protein
VSKNSDNEFAGAPDDEWSDESTMIRRGDDDPYLAEMARRSRSAGANESCFSGSASLDWDGHERRSNVVDCFDPYVVELTRPIRSEF